MHHFTMERMGNVSWELQKSNHTSPEKAYLCRLLMVQPFTRANVKKYCNITQTTEESRPCTVCPTGIYSSVSEKCEMCGQLFLIMQHLFGFFLQQFVNEAKYIDLEFNHFLEEQRSKLNCNNRFLLLSHIVYAGITFITRNRIL